MKRFLLIIGVLISLSAYSQSNAYEIKASIAGKSGGVISKEELLATESIALVGSEEKVTSFTLSIACRNKDPRDLQTNGNRLTKEVKDLIRETNSGCKVYFENIKVGSRLTKAVSFIIK